MSEFEYMVVWPLIGSLLAVFMALGFLAWAQHVHNIEKERREARRIRMAYDRYITKSRDEYLDQNNIPEWFEKYKKIQLDGEDCK